MMNKYILLIALLVVSLSGCWKAPKLFQLSTTNRTGKSISLVKENKNAAAKIMDTTLKLYPEFISNHDIFKPDTVMIPEIQVRTEYKDKPVTDTAMVRKLVASQLNALDSLKFIISDRDVTNRILQRKAMEFVESGGMVTKDTLRLDTLGLSVNSWFYKNKLYTEARVKERTIIETDKVTETTFQPVVVCPDWWDYWQSKACMAIIILLVLAMILASIKLSLK